MEQKQQQNYYFKEMHIFTFLRHKNHESVGSWANNKHIKVTSN